MGRDCQFASSVRESSVLSLAWTRWPLPMSRPDGFCHRSCSPRRGSRRKYCDDPYLCVRGANAMVVMTEWVQYRTLDLQRLKRELAQPIVVDLRNIYRPDEMAALGFTYESVGHGGGLGGLDVAPQLETRVGFARLL
jgi:UDP-glucose/GDP-mannose dehydrogenase family, UDP binding domain